MAISDSISSTAKAILFWVLPCVMSMAAHGAAQRPVPVAPPVAAQGGPMPVLAEYLLLHQTRFAGMPRDSNARLSTCYEHGIAIGPAQAAGARR